MKTFFLRLCVIWRRFHRGSYRKHAHQDWHSTQIEALVRRANPFACWSDRANWIADVAEWLRHAGDRRIHFLLDWLDAHRAMRRMVRAVLQKTLREAVGPELFCVAGLPRESAFASELFARGIKRLSPGAAQRDLPALFAAMFPDSANAEWLLTLDQPTLSRIWRLCADQGIVHNCRQQIDEALIYLATMIVSVGVSPDFQDRLAPRMPLQATPFMALRRELEKYLLAGAHDDIALRSVRMLIAVCRAQTDRIYAYLDEYGVSFGLVYRIERMRAQLTRMMRLIDLRSAPDGSQATERVRMLLADVIDGGRHRRLVRGLLKQSFSLLARKLVERNAIHGERYAVRNRGEYRAMLKSAWIGGAVASFAVLGMLALPGAGPARFFEGLFASLNYAVAFIAVTALGGTLAAKQSALTTPVLAAKMGALDGADGLRALLLETGFLLRSQTAALLGNLCPVILLTAGASLAVLTLSGAPAMSDDRAHAILDGLSPLGPAPLYAILTGVLLWLAALFAGFADNWFALRGWREGLAHHRRLARVLGAARAARWAQWLESRIAGLAGNVSLALLLGMTPVIAQFFGVPLEVRHVTLSAGMLSAAATGLGWGVLASAEFWLAAGGVMLIAILNVGVAFGCALTLALRARDVPARVRRLVFRAIARHVAVSPRFFLLPDKPGATVTISPAAPAPAAQEHRARRSKAGR